MPKIYFATWHIEPSQGEALTKIGAKNQLLSFYYLNKLYEPRRLRRVRYLRRKAGLPEDELIEYIQTGTITPPKNLNNYD